MNAALRGTGLTDKDMFSPANQDIMGMNLLMNKAGREKLSAYALEEKVMILLVLKHS